MSEKTICADVWRERIVAQQASGQSICGWCRANGWPAHVFYYWRRRLGMQPPNLQQAVSRDGEPMRGHKAGPMGFAEVIAPAPASMPPIIASSTASVILLRLGGQRELVLPMAMDVEQIARLVAAIERSA